MAITESAEEALEVLDLALVVVRHRPLTLGLAALAGMVTAKRVNRGGAREILTELGSTLRAWMRTSPSAAIMRSRHSLPVRPISSCTLTESWPSIERRASMKLSRVGSSMFWKACSRVAPTIQLHWQCGNAGGSG